MEFPFSYTVRELKVTFNLSILNVFPVEYKTELYTENIEQASSITKLHIHTHTQLGVKEVIFLQK